MRKPDFFIIGAPKSGTSALWTYLREHPSVFMSDPKEPCFWAPEYPQEKRRTCVPIHNLEQYLGLFREAKHEHLVVGEASTLYLASDKAVDNILEFNPSARFLVMLRNPVDFLISWHRDRIFAFDEDQGLETAWDLQFDRAAGRQLPATCLLPQLLRYRQLSALGSQLTRFLGKAGRDRVYIGLYDDFRRDAAKFYREVLAFLNVPNDGRLDFKIVNEAKRHRFKTLGGFLLSPPEPLRKPIQVLRRTSRNLGLAKLGNRVLRGKPALQSPITAKFRAALVKELSNEVALLESLLNRDLSAWRC